MSGARKFAFDTEFDAAGEIIAGAQKKLTESDLEAARAEAYDLGKRDALAEAERQSGAALETLANAAAAILTRLDAESRAMREDGARVAMIAARKIAGAALEIFGNERALAAIESAMDALRHNPRLVIKLAPEAVESLKPRIAEMCEQHGYTGAVLVRPEAGLRTGAVIIDWSDGVIATDPQETAARVTELVDAALAASSAPL